MDAKELIKFHEGYSATPYKCTAGHTTIGYGHSLTAHGEDIPAKWTKECAEAAFIADYEKAERECAAMIRGFSELDAVRQAVLVDMAFNMGIGGLIKFRKMLNHLWLKQYSNAAKEMMQSKWAAQVGKRSSRLADMMMTGQWPKDVTKND